MRKHGARRSAFGSCLCGAAALGVVALAGAGCDELFGNLGGPTAFGNLYADNVAADVAKVVARLPAPTNPVAPLNRLGRPLVAGIRYGTPGLFIYDVNAGAMLWTKDMPVSSRPVLTDRAVIVQSGQDVVSLALADGHEMWRVPTEGMSFFGAAFDEKNAYLAIGVGVSHIGRLLAVDAETGSTRWKYQASKLFGRPAATNGLVFVPWEHQDISVIDRETQEEVARVRSVDDVVDFVHAGPRGVFYGARGLYRFDGKSYSGTKAGSTYWQPPMQGIPGDPELWNSAFNEPTGGRNAREKIRYFIAPAFDPSGQGTGLEHGSIYLLYFRFVTAFDAATGEIRWIYRHPDDIEAMSVEPSGIFLVDSPGTLTRLSADTGQPDWHGAVGLDVAAAVFDLGGFNPPAAATPPDDTMRVQLLQVILDQDNRLLAFRQYCIGRLAQLPDPEVTRDILDVYAQRTSPQSLKDSARAALSTRAQGAEHLIGALDTHTDYLMNTEAPPMGVVAQSLAAMGARQSVTGLIGHLLDPETPIDDLQEVASALVELGDASLISTFESYLTLYHADSAFEQNANTLDVLADGLLKFGGDPERHFLDNLVASAHTLPSLKQHIQQRYQEMEDARHAAEEAARLAAEAAAAAANQTPVVEQVLPPTLSREQIAQTMAAHQADIAPCIEAKMARSPTLMQIRLVWRLSNAGQASELSVLPSDDADLTSCLSDAMSKIEFPHFTTLSQRAQFTINIRTPEAPPGAATGPGTTAATPTLPGAPPLPPVPTLPTGPAIPALPVPGMPGSTGAVGVTPLPPPPMPGVPGSTGAVGVTPLPPPPPPGVPGSTGAVGVTPLPPPPPPGVPGSTGAVGVTPLPPPPPPGVPGSTGAVGVTPPPPPPPMPGVPGAVTPSVPPPGVGTPPQQTNPDEYPDELPPE